MAVSRKLIVEFIGDTAGLERANKRVAGSLKGVDAAASRSDRALGKTRGAFSSTARTAIGFGAAFVGARGVVDLITSSVGAAQRAEVSQKKLKTQLHASGIAYRDHAQQIDKVIQATSKLSGLDDEDLQDSFTNIVRVTGSVSKSLKLTGLAADFARARHMDVAKAGELLGKVAGGNVGILSRYGLAATKVTDAVDALKASHKKYTPEQLAAAQADDKAATSAKALAALQQKFGGQAKAYGETQAGAVDRLNVAIENLKEKVGGALAPTLKKVSDSLATFVQGMADGEGQGGKFVKTVKDIVGPVAGIARGLSSFAKSNPELAKTAASMAIIGGAAVKFGKLTGASSVLKFAFQRGNSVAAPLYVQDISGGLGGGAPGTTGKVGRAARVARKVAAAALPAAAVAVAANSGSSTAARLGQSATGAWLGSKVGGPVGAAIGAVAVPAASKAIEQAKAKGQDIKTIKGVFDALKVSTAEAEHFKVALTETGKSINGVSGSIAGIKTGKLQELKVALGLVSFSSDDAKAKAQKLAGIVDRELAGRMVTKIKGAWAAAKSSTDTNLGDINRIVARNMGRVRAVMGTDSDAGAAAIRANFGGAVDAIQNAMHAGKVSVSTGMSRINSLLSTELKTLGVSFTWGAAAGAPGLADSPLFPKSKKPATKNGSPYVLAPGAATGGLFQIGRAGDNGRDMIPMTVGGHNIIVGSGEQAAILNRHQQAELNARTADVGGLAGFFQKFKRPHYMASGGITGGRVSGSSATAAIANATIAKAAAKATATLSKVKGARPSVGPAGGPSGTGTFDGLPVARWIIPELAWARRHGWVGRITSGYRSHAHNVAQGRTYRSNHESTQYPGGAVDVGDRNAKGPGAMLAAVLSRYTGSRKLRWGGPTIGDWGHFSATGRAKGGFVGGSFNATAYGPPWGGIEGGGQTATGVNLQGGPRKYIVAVDPSVIPLHSKLKIWPNPFGYRGTFSAEDTGGAIKGNRIDFYDWKGRAHQNAWGHKNVQVQLAGAKAAKKMPKPGMAAFGGQGAKVTSRSPFRLQSGLGLQDHALSAYKKKQGVIRSVNAARMTAGDTGLETAYTLASSTPGVQDDYATAIKGRDNALLRIKQYQYGLTHGDKRVTGEMLQTALSDRDTWASRVDAASQAMTPDRSAEANNAGAASQADLAALLKDIKDELAKQNTRADAIRGSVDGTLTQWVTEMISGRMGTTAALSGQVPSSPGMTARL